MSDAPNHVPWFKFIGPRLPLGTHVFYMYRDYSNWNFYGEFYLAGRCQLEDFTQYLHEGCYFVPHLIGIESLTPEKMNEDDHWLHEIIKTEYAKPEKPILTSKKFISRLKDCYNKDWILLCTWV